MTTSDATQRSQREQDRYFDLNTIKESADHDFDTFTRTLNNKIPTDPAGEAIDKLRWQCLRARSQALVEQACIRASGPDRPPQSCFIESQERESCPQTLTSIRSEIASFEKKTRALYVEARRKEATLDRPLQTHASLLRQYDDLARGKTCAEDKRYDAFLRCAGERGETYTDIREMPQEEEIKHMRTERRALWREKFKATLDDDQTKILTISEKLAEQAISMEEVKDERRRFFSDLKAGTLSWATFAPQGITTTSAPQTAARTRTTPSTYPTTTNATASVTSFPGSALSSARRSAYASSVGHHDRPRSDSCLEPLADSVLSYVKDRGSSPEEQRDRIMAATLEHVSRAQTCGSQLGWRHEMGTDRSACV